MISGSWRMHIKDDMSFARSIGVWISGSFERFGPIHGPRHGQRTPLSWRTQQRAPRQVQIRQRKQGGQRGRVPGQTPVAPLGISKLALDDPKRVLHACPRRGQAMIDLVRVLGPFPAPHALERETPPAECWPDHSPSAANCIPSRSSPRAGW